MCDESAYDCIGLHLCPKLDGRPGLKSEGQWSARCPVHDDRRRTLGIRLGDKGQRIVWKCNKGCDGTKVKAAMIAEPIGISPQCIPWSGATKSPRPPRDDAATLAEIRRLLGERQNPVAFMVAVAGLLSPDLDERTAAEKAGVPTATYYRHRARLRT